MKRLTLYCLHGFWGDPQDWVPFRATLPPGIFTFCPKLAPKPEGDSLEAWAARFNRSALATPEPRVLLGYSMGARLAMHALLQSPQAWAGAIFVSGHPGLTDEGEKERRRESDRAWAMKFLESSWDELLVDWDAQPVFGGKAAPSWAVRRAADRFDLARSLVDWSLGGQSSLLEPLAACPVPQLWIAGEKDEGYAARARRAGRSWIAPGAAHRVPWEAPEAFAKHTQDFLKGLVQE